MSYETDLSKERKWFHKERASRVVAKIQKRNINAQYVPSSQDALSVLLDMIPPKANVARGDSVSLDQIGIIPELIKRGKNKIIDPSLRGPDGCMVADAQERQKMEKEVFSSDIFLTSTNTITLDGKLVNTDGHGNRVSAMICGPKKVIIIASVNKIVKDVNEALDRIRQYTAPINAKRHYLKHPDRKHFADLPCVRTGRCADCNHEWRNCRYTTIIEGSMLGDKGRINVVVVGEELGI